MFDFDKEEMMEETVPASEFEWDSITDVHAEQGNNAGRDAAIKAEGKREAFADFYQDRHNHRKDKVAITATRYATLSVLLFALSYIVRAIPWLGITIGVFSAISALITAYGVGKYSEM